MVNRRFKLKFRPKFFLQVDSYLNGSDFVRIQEELGGLDNTAATEFPFQLDDGTVLDGSAAGLVSVFRSARFPFPFVVRFVAAPHDSCSGCSIVGLIIWHHTYAIVFNSSSFLKDVWLAPAVSCIYTLPNWPALFGKLSP